MFYQESVYKFDNLSKFNVLSHFVSTRNGGVSSSPFSSLNLSFRSQDKNENVFKNRSILFESLRIPLKCITLGKQTHSGNVYVVSAAEKGRGSTSYDSAIPNSDSLVTDAPNICLMVLLADCVPVFFFDPHKKVVGITHAGRVGTESKISVNTALVLANRFNCEFKNILVGIGPAISKANYKISQDDALKLKNVLPSSTKSLHYHPNNASVDLALANKEQLLNIGLQDNNIEIANLCTFSLPDIFFSERRDGNPTGRFGAGIMLLE